MSYIRRGLGAVATACPYGYILTRDGCEPSGGVQNDDLAPWRDCPPGTSYDAPTDACKVLPCPAGYFRDPVTGDCHLQYTPPEPDAPAPPTEPEPKVPPVPGAPTEPTDAGPGWQPYPVWGDPPPINVTVEGGGGGEIPEPREAGFGMVSAGIALLVGAVLARGFQDMREA